MRDSEVISPRIKENFEAWAVARRGAANPENQTNPIWLWLAENRFWPHQAHEAAGSGKKQEPGWCFSRYGQTETPLPDGRSIYIGGEHEDFYDPDFYIYNDVVVFIDGRAAEVFGYPTADFPPTDFHSATLADDRIVIIGRLGYPEDREDGVTPVYLLSLDDLRITELKTTGQQPSWLHRHSAVLADSGKAIFCEGGVCTHNATRHLVENIAQWRLCLLTGAWTHVGERNWTRWLLMRDDESPNELWDLGQVSWAEKTKEEDKWVREITARFASRAHVTDSKLYETRYTPHEKVFEIEEDEDDFRTHTVSFGGYRVRFVEGYDSVLVTSEGEQDEVGNDTLIEHYVDVFSRLEGVPYKAIKL